MSLHINEIHKLMKDAGAGPDDRVPTNYTDFVKVFSHVANAAYTLGLEHAHTAQPSLRDQFAGQAMQGFAADPEIQEITAEQVAEAAYCWADAMMKVRTK